MAWFRAGPYDREIVRLAVPALGALTVEPLYVLVDTAIVGRLGTTELGGLAVAGAVLVAVFNICNFLAYSTTAAVARRIGAGDARSAANHGVAGAWLALGLGALLTVVGLVLAPLIVDVMGASARVRPEALTYLRISLLGAPAMLTMLAGMGYLRGLQDTRTTFVVALAANLANVVLELAFVYGFDWGIAGSAWGTVVAQYGAALAYLVLVGRTARAAGASLRPHGPEVRAVAAVGGVLAARTASLLAAFTAATAVAARIDDDSVAAHQIGFQLFLFLGLALDALAIAAQAMIGRMLGAADPAGARAAARRMLEWGVLMGVVLAVVLVAARVVLVPVFTDDATVRALADDLVWIVAALMPLLAVVFVLDGVLIGASDVRYLAVAMAGATFLVFAPALVLVGLLDGSLLWLWGALALFMGARAIGNVARFRGTGWQVTGAEPA